MGSTTSYTRYTWFVLIFVFLVILAGGVVRMTQSGMGCPDWPTCFGRWIPPTSADQLPADYEKYLKQQDIDHTFNVYHTWIEYINRLLGAILGVLIFIHFIWSVKKFRKTDRQVVLLSLFLLIAVAFQGWLGKKVVDHNLATVKVTTHMLVAILIAAVPLLIIYRLRYREKIISNSLKIISTVVLLLLLVQIGLGTQVREAIDEISKPLKYQQRETWMSQLGNEFYIHRSFSWIVLAACLLLCWNAWKIEIVSLKRNTLLILGLAFISVALGIIMAWYSIPAIAQPLHLLAATALILAVFALRLRLK